MDRRLRTVAGLLGLVALTASLAEAVLASTCATMDMAGEGATVMSTEAHGAPGTETGPAACVQAPAPVGDDRSCPFESPLAAQVCLGVVSLPASSAPLPRLGSEGPVPDRTVVSLAGLLHDGALFRPPRA